MSQRGLEALLRPKSIAVIGASMKPNRAGYLMMRNLLAGGFNGPVLPVTPAWKAVLGVLAWPDIASLPFTPDLAVLCTNASRNLALLEELGEKGCKTCIILSAPASQHEDLRACALRHNMRLLGPNSLGLLAPWQGLNASFSPVPIKRGKLAFISQSAAVSNTILDWAQQREMGFSYFIALGDSLDIDVDELLDYLARDSKTSAILLYLEQLSDARRFVSAARSASRNKPILVIKSGRSPAAQRLLNTTAGMDPAWDAAIQRAGLLRVQDTHELFSAVETLSHMRPLRGDRLMIISNGAAPAALALDANVFFNKFKDKISDYTICTATATQKCVYNGYEAEEVSQYFNVSDAEIYGLELNGDWQVTPALKANANYTYTHSEQKSGQYKGEALNEFPSSMANLSLTWNALNDLELWTKASWRSNTPNTGKSTSTEAYALVDLGARYHLNKRITLMAGVYNLFDVNPIYKTSYNQSSLLEGRRYNMGARFEF